MEINYIHRDLRNMCNRHLKGDILNCLPNMQPALLVKLCNISQELNKPLTITSAYRSPEYNAKIGGVTNSAHCRGLAVDIACNDSSYRFKLLKILNDYGFRRIGIYKTFIHVDVDYTKPIDVIWYG